jgi:hypothetical protein
MTCHVYLKLEHQVDQVIACDSQKKRTPTLNLSVEEGILPPPSHMYDDLARASQKQRPPQSCTLESSLVWTLPPDLERNMQCQ